MQNHHKTNDSETPSHFALSSPTAIPCGHPLPSRAESPEGASPIEDSIIVATLLRRRGTARSSHLFNSYVNTSRSSSRSRIKIPCTTEGDRHVCIAIRSSVFARREFEDFWKRKKVKVVRMQLLNAKGIVEWRNNVEKTDSNCPSQRHGASPVWILNFPIACLLSPGWTRRGSTVHVLTVLLC